MASPLDFMYDTFPSDVSLFGENYVISANVDWTDREWHRVAEYPKRTPGGQSCDIYEVRMPARFYRLVARESTNSAGDVVPGWSLQTGSGDEMAKLMIALAKAANEGMVSKGDEDGDL